MEADAKPIEWHDWLILEALSDDYESVEQIVEIVAQDWPDVASLEVIKRLEALHDAGHVF